MDMLAQAKQLWTDGKRDDAITLCCTWLASNKQDADMLHLLAMLYIEQGHYDAAQPCLDQAWQLQPENTVFGLHLANLLKMQGDYSQAEQQLLSMIMKQPDFAAAYNNLGTVYFAQENWAQAEEKFTKAIRCQSDYADAYYNLGLVQLKLNETEKALRTFKSLALLSPKHPGCHFQIGLILMSRAQYQDALSYFESLVKAFPYHVESYCNLASCLMQLNDMTKAAMYYQQALAIQPNDTQVLFNLGVISMKAGQFDEAMDYLHRVIYLEPQHSAAYQNLGVISLARQDRVNALVYFSAALREEPHDEALAHMVKILSERQGITTSPTAYVSALFDSYATYFDKHLRDVLHYRVPEALLGLLQAHVKQLGPAWQVVDIGCGTGLCGERFRPHVASLVGVDVSAGMLAVAQQKQIYDQLVQEEAVTYLLHHPQQYDLILAADVLVYIGELDDLFRAVSQALRSGSYFLFSIEQDENSDYSLTETGRFVHSSHYVKRTASANGLQILANQAMILRTQEGRGTAGFLYLMQACLE